MRLIDADALGIDRCNPGVFQNAAYAAGWNGVINIIRSASTIDAVPVVHAQWEILEEPNTFDTFGNHAKYVACTNCGFRWNDIYAVKNYFKCCPSCGAKMDASATGGDT